MRGHGFIGHLKKHKKKYLASIPALAAAAGAAAYMRNRATMPEGGAPLLMVEDAPPPPPPPPAALPGIPGLPSREPYQGDAGIWLLDDAEDGSSFLQQPEPISRPELPEYKRKYKSTRRSQPGRKKGFFRGQAPY